MYKYIIFIDFVLKKEFIYKSRLRPENPKKYIF